MTRYITLLATLACPATGRAADLTDLFPDDAAIVSGVHIKGIMNSPLGKKVVGTDKPFDVSRKLLGLKLLGILSEAADVVTLLPSLPFDGEAVTPVAVVANKLERVTVVVTRKLDSVIFLEGEIDEVEVTTAAKAIANVSRQKFRAGEVGDRKLVVLEAGETGATFGTKVNKSLFVIASTRDQVSGVLTRHDGKGKSKLSKPLTTALGKVKPAETPVWLAAGGTLNVFGETTIPLVTVAVELADDVDVRHNVECSDEEESKRTEEQLRRSQG